MPRNVSKPVAAQEEGAQRVVRVSLRVYLRAVEVAATRLQPGGSDAEWALVEELARAKLERVRLHGGLSIHFEESLLRTAIGDIREERRSQEVLAVTQLLDNR